MLSVRRSGSCVALLGLSMLGAACTTADVDVSPRHSATASHAADEPGPSSPPVPSDIAPPLSSSGSAAPPSPSASLSAAEPAAPPPCPADMVLVGRFCVDRHEAFLLRVADDGSRTPHPYYERPLPNVRYEATNRAGAAPQGYISRVESKAACEAAGKRLCSRREWTRACKNKGFMIYPYGQRGVRDKCNTGKIHLLSQMFKNPRGGFKYEDHFNSPDLNKTPGFLAKSGEFAGCVSDLGVTDMVGNLHEWVSDKVDQDLMDKLEEDQVERRDQPWQEGNGIFMGGFYSTTSEHGPGCFFTTVAHEPSYHDYSTGFRCCKAATLPPPEPKAPKPSKKLAR